MSARSGSWRIVPMRRLMWWADLCVIFFSSEKILISILLWKEMPLVWPKDMPRGITVGWLSMNVLKRQRWSSRQDGTWILQRLEENLTLIRAHCRLWRRGISRTISCGGILLLMRWRFVSIGILGGNWSIITADGLTCGLKRSVSCTAKVLRMTPRGSCARFVLPSAFDLVLIKKLSSY